MDLDRVIADRHSCRAFLPDQVPETLVTEIIEVAQRAPSWCNSQAWHLDVTSGAATSALSEALMAAATAQEPAAPDVAWPQQYVGVYAERRRTCGFQLYDSVSIAREDRVARGLQALENLRFFGAPHVAVVTSPADLGAYGLIDCGAFVANFLLVAQSRGLATIAQAAPTMYSRVLHETLQIDQERLVVCAIAFGYADAEHPANGFRTHRARTDEVVRHHR